MEINKFGLTIITHHHHSLYQSVSIRTLLMLPLPSQVYSSASDDKLKHSIGNICLQLPRGSISLHKEVTFPLSKKYIHYRLCLSNLTFLQLFSRLLVYYVWIFELMMMLQLLSNNNNILKCGIVIDLLIIRVQLYRLTGH